jgi:hypothetical protein
MNQVKQLNDTTVKTNSKVLWYGIQASPPMMMAFVYFMNKFSQLEPILPDLKNVFISLCLFSIVTPFILLGYFKRLQNTVRDNMRLGMDNSPTELHRYIAFLVIGMALCDMSAVFGFVLYMMTGEMNYALFFISISFLLGFLYKPELN